MSAPTKASRPLPYRVWHDPSRADPWRWCITADWPDDGMGNTHRHGGAETRELAELAAQRRATQGGPS